MNTFFMITEVVIHYNKNGKSQVTQQEPDFPLNGRFDTYEDAKDAINELGMTAQRYKIHKITQPM